MESSGPRSAPPPRRPSRHGGAATPLAPASAVPTLRQTQKEATRAKVLDAARELFESVGYQGATIREIARIAGVSVGSVFTSFASKGEMLSEVMGQRLELLYAELDRVVPHLRGSTPDRLRSIFAVHIAFEARRTRLFLAHIAAAYDWTLPATARPFGRTPRLVEMLKDCLAKGVEQGDVDPACDLDEVVEMLIAAYAWTYQLTITEGADAEAMTRAMDRRIGLIAEGFQAR